MHMIFKNKLIIYITSAGFIPPQLEYPSFGELEIYLVGKMYGAGWNQDFEIGRASCRERV